MLRIAATVGNKLICPILPGLGAGAGREIAIATLPIEIAILGPLGVATTITAAHFGEVVGYAAGEELKAQICA